MQRADATACRVDKSTVHGVLWLMNRCIVVMRDAPRRRRCRELSNHCAAAVVLEVVLEQSKRNQDSAQALNQLCA